jgi:hypothetical protein
MRWRSDLADTDLIRNDYSALRMPVRHPPKSYDLRREQGAAQVWMPWVRIVEVFVILFGFLER